MSSFRVEGFLPRNRSRKIWIETVMLACGFLISVRILSMIELSGEMQ